jgi:protein O-GlcNAc transferase
MATTHANFETAFAHHQAGRVREAEAIYRQILGADPNHFEALHLLGLVEHHFGRHDEAVELIVRAIALAGQQARYHSNLGEVYRVQGKLAEAEQALRQALSLEPKSPEALNNLGIVLGALGKSAEAIQAYSQAIVERTDFAEPHNNLAAILYGQGKVDDAIAHYRKAVQKNPRYAEAYNNLGTALKSKGRLDDAEQAYRQALRLAPHLSDAHLNLGSLLEAGHQHDLAIDCFRQAISLDPRSALAHANLGIALHAQHQLHDAIDHYRRALEIDPRDADTCNNLGLALKSQIIRDHVAQECQGVRNLVESPRADIDPDNAYIGVSEIRMGLDFTAAAEQFRRAVDGDPRHAKALVNLGKLLEDEGLLDEALAHYDRALESDPRYAKAHLYRADAYRLLRRTSEAISGYRAAIDLQPHNPEAYNQLGVLFNDLDRPDEAIEACHKGLDQEPGLAAFYNTLGTALAQQGRMDEGVAAGRKAVSLQPGSRGAFSNLIYGLNRVPQYDPATLFEEHLEWARRHAEPLTALAETNDNDPTPNRRLRVGYVSPYFRNHAVNFFSEPLIVSHDSAEFEIFCYSDVRVPVNATERLQAAVDHWRDCSHMSDKQLAETVRADAIDVLVDLTGHIAGSRLLAFARKPAPVQVTYLGYQNTTGMSAMDYRLTDTLADPPGTTDKFYTEKLVRLPRAFFCYRPSDKAPPPSPLPAIAKGHVTFGSFNNFNKLTPQAIGAWLQILDRVPDSRLLLLSSTSDYVARRLENLARAHGLDPARIELVHKRPLRDYYALVQQADIALDPFPFNGHTTTCDAIWLGVPVVMLQGRMYASRFGGSVLANVGLDDLIARSVSEYVDKAVELAGDLDRLAELRAQLRPRMAASPLLDFQGFARNVEAAYRQMWTDWCAKSRAPER